MTVPKNKTPRPSDENTALLWPDCGCPTPEDCLPCPTCGSCIRNREFCPCKSVQRDEALGFDIFKETSGG